MGDYDWVPERLPGDPENYPKAALHPSSGHGGHGAGAGGGGGFVPYAGSPYAGTLGFAQDPLTFAFNQVKKRKLLADAAAGGSRLPTSPAAARPTAGPPGGNRPLDELSQSLYGSGSGGGPMPSGSPLSSTPGTPRTGPTPVSFDQFLAQIGGGPKGPMGAQMAQALYKNYLAKFGTANSVEQGQTAIQNQQDVAMSDLMKSLDESFSGQQRADSNELQALGMDDPSLYSALLEQRQSDRGFQRQGILANARAGGSANIRDYMEQLGLNKQSFDFNSILQNQRLDAENPGTGTQNAGWLLGQLISLLKAGKGG